MSFLIAAVASADNNMVNTYRQYRWDGRLVIRGAI